MMTIIVVIAAIVASILIFIMATIMAWEIVADIKGVLNVPTWLDNLYHFVCR